MKRLGTAATALILLLCILLSGAAQAESILYVQGGWLRMRSAPSFDAQTIASYYTGSAMTYLGASGAWYYVQGTDGKVGYMYSAYLTPTPPGPQPQPQPQPGGSTAYVWAANGRGVRLRQGPGTNYGVIGLYNVGTSVQIISRGTYWHYIQVGKQTGYMMAQYLVDQAPSPQPQPQPQPEPSGGYTAYVWAANGKPVNLREGAGKNYRAITRFAVGTQVTVISHGATWDYIQAGTQAGYMMNRYLKTTAPAPSGPVTITGVSLSNTAPGPNQSVSALVSPSGATFSCKWYNDQGALLSTGSSYTVQYTDVGRRLLVTVTGTGNTSGYATSPYSAVITSTIPHVTTLTAVTIDNLYPTAGVAIHARVTPIEATANYTWYRDDGAVLGNSATYAPQATDVNHRLYCLATGAGTCSGTVVSSFTAPVSGGSSSGQLSGSVVLPASTSAGLLLTPTVMLNTGHLTYTWYANNVVVGSGATLYVDSSMQGTSLRVVVSAAPGSGYEGSVSSGYCQVLNNYIPQIDTPPATNGNLWP